MLGQQVMQHAGVLHADEGAENAHHPGWHTEIETDAVGMAGTSPSAGANDQLVPRKIGDDLVEQGKYGSAPAVDDALPADLDDIGVRAGWGGRAGIRLDEQRLVSE